MAFLLDIPINVRGVTGCQLILNNFRVGKGSVYAPTFMSEVYSTALIHLKGFSLRLSDEDLPSTGLIAELVSAIDSGTNFRNLSSQTVWEAVAIHTWDDALDSVDLFAAEYSSSVMLFWRNLRGATVRNENANEVKSVIISKQAYFRTYLELLLQYQSAAESVRVSLDWLDLSPFQSGEVKGVSDGLNFGQ